MENRLTNHILKYSVCNLMRASLDPSGDVCCKKLKEDRLKELGYKEKTGTMLKGTGRKLFEAEHFPSKVS